MMTLYACLGSGNCMKPWLALNQLKQDFDVKLIDVLSGEQKSPDYLAINPAGVVPFLHTNDAGWIGESNAMLWYLCEGSPLMPPTPLARAQALQWMFFEQSKLEPFLSPARFFTHILPDQRDTRADDIAIWQSKAADGLAQLDAHFAGQDFVVPTGYSLADIAVFGYVHVLEQAGLSGAAYPHVLQWIDRVEHTDGFVPLADLGQQAVRAA